MESVIRVSCSEGWLDIFTEYLDSLCKRNQSMMLETRRKPERNGGVQQLS